MKHRAKNRARESVAVDNGQRIQKGEVFGNGRKDRSPEAFEVGERQDDDTDFHPPMHSLVDRIPSEDDAEPARGIESTRELKVSSPGHPVEFCLKAPSAGTVKLAGEFTQWEKAALTLAKNGDGIWKARVVLPPGRYAYRFLVDGDWHDDPHCTESLPNPYGSTNAIVEIP